jgi:butyryl-CoA dehydrogenase
MNEQREQMVGIAREFAQTECRPWSMRIENSDESPIEMYRRVAELGFLGTWFPEEYGGLGLDWTCYCLINEEIAKELPVLCIPMGGSVHLGGGIIFHGGTEEQKRYWLPKIATGEVILGASNTEPTGCNNPIDMAATAVPDGDGWVLNASKIFTTSISIATHMLVSAKTSEFDPRTLAGLSWFIVDINTPGVEIGKVEHKLGWHGSNTGSIFFKNVRVPKDALIGPEPGHQLHQIFPTMSGENLMVGVELLGQAEDLFTRTWEYTRTRIQHGQSLFDQYQVVRHKLARMRMEIDGLRALIYSTAAELDAGRDPGILGRECKIKGCEVLTQIGQEAIQLHGGNGVVVENAIERPYRDVRVSAIAGGPVEFLIDNIIELLGHGVEPLL